jgi:chorismate mutase domain of proteobacterial P-protein, clade 2
MSDLSEIREKIDAIDSQLLKLLNERATLALEVGRIKSRDGLPIYAPDREMLLLRGLVEKSEGPLSPTAIRAIYREIMSAALALEKDVVIAVSGPEGARAIRPRARDSAPA